MNKKLVHNLDDMTFYMTVEEPCSYLDDQMERKIFTRLNGDDVDGFFNELSKRGFRRSQNIAYIPACQNCNACKSSRIIVDEFSFSKSQRRVLNKNKNLLRKTTLAHPTSEQYRLFNKYIKARHGDGEMGEMGVLDYAKMIAETNVNTKMVEYYMPNANDAADEGQLIAAVLTDIMSDGTSMVYSFFDPNMPKNSLGTYLVLDHIRQAKLDGLPYVYLGYYIDGCANMAYKAKFKPQQQFDGFTWKAFD